MEQLIIIKTLEKLNELKEYIKDKDFISYDTETNGVTKDSKIIGFSICADIDVGYYVVLSYWDVDKQQLIELETVSGMKDFLQSLSEHKLVMHNSAFDCYMTRNNFQIELINSVHTDTLILGHILNENRRNGLKELGVSLFGEDSRTEQTVMKDSVAANGGRLTKDHYELYKADCDLIGRYGAKDAILTLKIFYQLVPELIEEKLDGFFYDDESMPLLRGPTYDLNTTGLKVDIEALTKLKATLQIDCMEAKAFIYKEIEPHVKEKYKGTKPSNTFNIGASQQLSWLLFSRLGNDFNTLTDSGKAICKFLEMRLPYSAKARRDFVSQVMLNKDRVYEPAKINPKTGKLGRPKKISDFWKYVSCGKESLTKLSKRHEWVKKLLEYAKNLKLLNTYATPIEAKMQYGIIRPSFFQHGTTSGRYSSKNPNFQNLPRDDKRIKACIVSRPGKSFVGADYSQLEPRVFASFSGDERLLDCFKTGRDFYSVIGMEVFNKFDCDAIKDGGDNSFAKKYPELRQIAKTISLSATYGTTAPKMALAIGQTMDEAQEVIDTYFMNFPNVHKMMISAHERVKTHGVVHNLFGRPRRIPEAMDIPKLYKKSKHEDLPYKARKMLNLAVNHTIQGTGASIINRAAILFYKMCKDQALDVKIVLQVHDELIVECFDGIAQKVAEILKYSMENAVILPGVSLVALPVIGKNLADLK